MQELAARSAYASIGLEQSLFCLDKNLRLAERWGVKPALVLGFLFSGLVHEAAITIPAGGGYGGPALYFCLQAAAILVERSAWGRSSGLGNGLRGRIFAGLVLLLPAPLLFPEPFVVRVVIPFMTALGA